MIAFFVSALKQNARGGWYPEISDVFDSLGTPFKWVFSTMSGGTQSIAVGILECTPEQLGLIDAAPNVWAMDTLGWNTILWRETGVSQRNKVHQVLGTKGRTADSISQNDTKAQVFDKLLAAMPERTINTIEDLLLLWQSNHGPIIIESANLKPQGSHFD